MSEDAPVNTGAVSWPDAFGRVSRYGGCRPSCTAGRPEILAAGSVTCSTSSTIRRSWWTRGNACPRIRAPGLPGIDKATRPDRDLGRGRGVPGPDPGLAEVW